MEVLAQTSKGSGVFGVPGGISTGQSEAWELRDGGTKFWGLGVLKAVANVNDILAKKIKGMDVYAQKRIDQALCELDGTENKSRLGANAILGISGAVCKAAAAAKQVPVYKYVAMLHKSRKLRLPQPSVLVIEGGAHGDTNLDIQEFMLLPQGSSVREKLEIAAEIFQTLRKILKLHRLDTDLGFEGGFAPSWESNQQVFALIWEAIKQTGHKVQLAIDAAASEFYNRHERQYVLKADHTSLSAERLVSLYNQWIGQYPLVLIEDGLAEEDWDGWRSMQQRLGDKIILVGDDLFTTQKSRLKKGVEAGVANAIIIKPNQVGTVSETLETVALAQKHNYKVAAKHRSGETNDDFIADFAVGIGADYLMAGSVARGERVAKWNRLLAIEEELS